MFACIYNKNRFRKLVCQLCLSLDQELTFPIIIQQFGDEHYVY